MTLSPKDKTAIQQYYRKKLKRYGTKSALSVDWDSDHNQIERFKILSKIGDLTGKSVLDFGSGLGDLYGYLSKRFKGVKYLGIDILPEFIEEAKKKYKQGNFELKELDDVKESFDYVFASGSLTYKMRKDKNFYLKIVEELYQRAKMGVAFNMLDKGFYGIEKFYMTYDPIEVYNYCKAFAKDIKIVVEYAPGDFTIYLYKKKQK
jgi:cyclopropane fatty-acyl-phospholipid synthase-like methyltransferase